ncbi:MAG TPA: Mpv17/PMP22 family protein [Chthoniobacterales bacterium]
MSSIRPPHRTPFALGWEAARANLIPGLLLQGLMLALLLGYYFSPAVARLLERFAHFKLRHGLPFVLVAAVAAGAILPEIFLILFFQRGRPNRRNLRNLCFTIPIWAFDGGLVDLLYRGEAAWLGNVVTLPVVLAKICLDQFGYNPFFAAPFGVLTYEWKNSGFSFESLVRGFTSRHYREKVVPTLLATWAIWIPLMAIIYSVPLSLQFPLFSLALTFWVLILTYMTNSFAARHVHSPRPADLTSPALI